VVWRINELLDFLKRHDIYEPLLIKNGRLVKWKYVYLEVWRRKGDFFGEIQFVAGPGY